MKTVDKKDESIIDKVNSLEDLFKLYKPTKEEQNLIDYKGTSEKMNTASKCLVACIIEEVFNEGKVPEPNCAWLPYYSTRGGFAFSRSHCGDRVSAASVGSRLGFVNRMLSDHAGKTFPEIYKSLVTKNPK